MYVFGTPGRDLPLTGRAIPCTVRTTTRGKFLPDVPYHLPYHCKIRPNTVALQLLPVPGSNFVPQNVAAVLRGFIVTVSDTVTFAVTVTVADTVTVTFTVTVAVAVTLVVTTSYCERYR